MAIVKLNSIVNRIDDIKVNIEIKIESLREKQQALEDKAAEYDREPTDAELARYDAIDDQVEELEGEIDAIDAALDYLNDYCEW